MGSMTKSIYDTYFHFHMDTRPEFSTDLLNEDTAKTELCINNETLNIDQLSDFKKLTKVWIYTINQKQFDDIVSRINPEMLLIYGLRASDLTALAKLDNLKHLCLDWNTKATSLWDFSQNGQLETLAVRDFSALRDISELSRASTLKGLSLEGGMWKSLQLNSLEPLVNMTSLKYLSLHNLKVVTGSIRSLKSLKQLEELAISNQFPTEDYAFLSVHLPDVKCSKFMAYQSFSPAIEGKNIMVIGKRKPLLNSTTDKKRLAKYECEFEQLKEMFRHELNLGDAKL